MMCLCKMQIESNTQIGKPLLFKIFLTFAIPVIKLLDLKKVKSKINVFG